MEQEQTQSPPGTVADLGKKVKQKYPGQYDSLPDDEVGRRIKAKYPDAYGSFADITPAPAPVPGKPQAPPAGMASPSTSVAGGGPVSSSGVGQPIIDAAGDAVMTKEIVEQTIPAQPQLAIKKPKVIPTQEEFKALDLQAKRDLLSTAKDLGTPVFSAPQQYMNTSDPTGMSNVPPQDTRRQYLIDDLMQSLPEHRKTYINTKIEAGDWTDKDAAALEVEAVDRAARMVNARIVDLEDRMSQGYQPSEDEINEIKAHADYVSKEAASGFAEVIKRHPELRREVEEDKLKAIEAEAVKMVDPKWAYVAEPAVRAAAGFASNLLRTPRTFSGDDEYGWTDKLAEYAEGVMERSEAQRAPSLQGPVVTKDAEGNLSVSGEKLIPKTVETLVSSLMMVGGGAGTAPGLVASSFMQTNPDYYRAALDNGATAKDAAKYAATASSITSALEVVSPQNYLWTKATRDMGLRAVKEMAKGKSITEAMKSAQTVLKEIGKEEFQEISQMVADKLVNAEANERLKVDNPYFAATLDDEFKAEEVAETFIVTAAMSGLMAGAATVASRNPIDAEAVRWAAENPQLLTDAMQKYGVPQDQQQQIVEKAEKYRRAFGGFKETGDPVKDKVIADAVIKKEEVREQQKNSPVDELIASIQGNKFEEQLKALDEEIAAEMGIDLVEVAKKQEADRLIEQYEKAKLKSEITGTPMPEGMTKPKEVVLEPKDVEVVAPKPPTTPATSSKPTFGEKPDKEADAPVWSSLSIGSVLTDSSDPNIHWVVVDDTRSKRRCRLPRSWPEGPSWWPLHSTSRNHWRRGAAQP